MPTLLGGNLIFKVMWIKFRLRSKASTGKSG